MSLLITITIIVIFKSSASTISRVQAKEARLAARLRKPKVDRSRTTYSTPGACLRFLTRRGKLGATDGAEAAEAGLSGPSDNG